MVFRKSSAAYVSYVLFAFLLAQIPFAAGSWVSQAESPTDPGDYTITIKALYKGISSSYPVGFTVYNGVENSELYEISPQFQRDLVPPISLTFNILFNDQQLSEISSSDVVVISRDDPKILLPQSSLSGSDGLFQTELDVPFAGDYAADINISTIINETSYQAHFSQDFHVSEASSELDFEVFLREQVFEVGQVFEVRAALRFHDSDLADSNILYASIGSTRSRLIWNERLHIYETTITAPTTEGVYYLNVYATNQGIKEIFPVYTLDLSKELGDLCPISSSAPSCNSKTEARRCFSDYKKGESGISDEQLISCIESSGLTEIYELPCTPGYMGDLDGDRQIDDDDISLMSSQILSDFDPSHRNQYLDCADFDLDGDVDEEDLICLAYVNAGKWEGGVGGGVCVDFTTLSPAKGDLDGDRKITAEDKRILTALANASSRGFKLSEDLFDFTDFNQDSIIDDMDTACLTHFIGMDLDASYLDLFTTEIIPNTCWALYELDACRGISGDINGDMIIDETDEILIMAINKGYVSDTLINMRCSDVNHDNVITSEDELCVKSYVSGDVAKYFVCIGCVDNLPPKYFSFSEICGDGWDNDCDGLEDRTSTDPLEDECMCGPQTSCMRFYDNDLGNSPGIQDGNYLVCRKLSWEGDEYQWTPIIPCSADIECETSTCENQVKICTYFDSYHWLDDEDVPEEPEADPLCEDGHDNDCQGGDAECPEDLFDSVFGWMTAIITAIAVTIAMAYMCPIGFTHLFGTFGIHGLYLSDLVVGLGAGAAAGFLSPSQE